MEAVVKSLDLVETLGRTLAINSAHNRNYMDQVTVVEVIDPTIGRITGYGLDGQATPQGSNTIEAAIPRFPSPTPSSSTARSWINPTEGLCLSSTRWASTPKAPGGQPPAGDPCRFITYKLMAAFRDARDELGELVRVFVLQGCGPRRDRGPRLPKSESIPRGISRTSEPTRRWIASAAKACGIMAAATRFASRGLHRRGHALTGPGTAAHCTVGCCCWSPSTSPGPPRTPASGCGCTVNHVVNVRRWPSNRHSRRGDS